MAIKHLWEWSLGVSLVSFALVSIYDLVKLFVPSQLEHPKERWRTTMGEEVVRNLTTIASFAMAILFSELLLIRLSPLSRLWAIVLPIAFIPLLFRLILPREYVVGKDGIVMDGLVYPWRKFKGFVMQEKLGRIMLVRHKYAQLAPLFINHSDLKEAKAILTKYLDGFASLKIALRFQNQKGIEEE